MKCEDCQQLLSEFIDNLLDAKQTARVKAHLTLCSECAELHHDFASILGICDLEIVEEIPLPNEQALWCRINNIIESEIKQEAVQEFKEKQTSPGVLSKLWNRSWSLSFTQLASAVLGIALISSLLTVVGIRNAAQPAGDSLSTVANASVQATLFETVLSKIGVAETPRQAREQRLREQQATIDYWNKRVAARRTQWDKNLREAFDRNLSEIEQVVAEYTKTLQENPQDELSNEMLDSAMSEKMELLREFSEL